ncbi:MAG: hypothetical protein AAGD05_01685, partial [Bacteroidota bacterium]
LAYSCFEFKKDYGDFIQSDQNIELHPTRPKSRNVQNKNIHKVFHIIPILSTLAFGVKKSRSGAATELIVFSSAYIYWVL